MTRSRRTIAPKRPTTTGDPVVGVAARGGGADVGPGRIRGAVGEWISRIWKANGSGCVADAVGSGLGRVEWRSEGLGTGGGGADRWDQSSSGGNRERVLCRPPWRPAMLSHDPTW